MTEQEWLVCNDPTKMLEFLRGQASDRKLRLFAVACCRRVWSLFAYPSGRRAVEVAELYADRAASEATRYGAFYEAARDAVGWTNNGDVVGNAMGYATSAATYVVAHEDTVETEATGAGAGDVVIMTQAIHAVEWHSPAMIVALDTAYAAGCAVVAHFDERERAAVGEEWEYPHRDEAEQILAAAPHYAKAVGIDPDGTCPPDYEMPFQAVRQAEARRQCELLRCIAGNPFRPPATLPQDLLAWNDATAVRLAQAIYAERAFDRLPILADALEDAGCSDGALLSHLRDPGPHVRGCWAVDLILGKH